MNLTSPGSSLSDDLYALYLAGFGFVVGPFYGSVLALALPTEWDGFSEALSFAVPLLALVAAWSGLRGGPLFISRGGVIQELLSPASRRVILLRRLLRQTVTWLVVTALAANALRFTVGSGPFDFNAAAAVSSVAGLAAASTLLQAVLWSVVAHDGEQKLRLYAFSAALSIPTLQISALVAGQRFTNMGGLWILLTTVVLAGLFALLVLDRVSVEMLWKRASTFDSMQSAMLTFDLQQVFLNVRQVSEQPASGASSSSIPRLWPLPLWRLWASMRHNLKWHVPRTCALIAALGGLYWWSDLGQGLAVLAITGCMFFIAMELSGPVAVTAAHKVFLIHYPSGSGSVLRGQVTTTVGLGLVLGLIVGGFGVTETPSAILGTVLLSGSGSLAATMQARLGSPDLAAIVERYGYGLIQPVLLVRAFLGPILVLISSIGTYHQFFRFDSQAISWITTSLAVGLLAAFLVSTKPLKGLAK